MCQNHPNLLPLLSNGDATCYSLKSTREYHTSRYKRDANNRINLGKIASDRSKLIKDGSGSGTSQPCRKN
jgi:hypothetical protein